jgi:uncharacterized protein (DUF58 family)
MVLFDNYEINEIKNLELLAKQVVEGFIIGLHKSPFHGFSVEFAEHRIYNPGESTRNIDWKVYARSDRMYTKRYEEETNLRCQIVLDASSSMYYPDPSNPAKNKLGFSALAACALMNLLKKQRDAFGCSIFNEKLEINTKCRSSTAHYQLLLSYIEKYLNQHIPNTKTSAAAALHQIAESTHRRSLVVIFSDMFETTESEESLFSALQHLKHNKHEVLLFHVVDAAKELQFEFDNRPYEFTDIETNEKIKLQPNQIKDFYQTQMETYLQNLKNKCLQYHVDFIPCDINKGFKPILQSYLIKRDKMSK